MKTFLRGLALFYGTQMFLSSIGLAAFFTIAGDQFSQGSVSLIDERTVLLLTCVAVPTQLGMGLTLVFFGLTHEARAKVANGAAFFWRYVHSI